MGDYSKRFIKFIPFIFNAECAFSKGHYGDFNHVIPECVPGDSGSWTKWGVDLSGHPSLTVQQIKNLTEEQAQQIYFNEWCNEGIEGMPYPFGECFYDCAVNAGTGRARKILAKTGQDANAFLAERDAFYRRLAAAVSVDRKFLAGWLNRIANLRSFLHL